MSDSVYAGLLGTDPSHWAFGTDFVDPVSELGDRPVTVPDGQRREFAVACLALGDDALVFAHRLSEWCSRAPDLEEDIALANIALDLLGQARVLLGRAAAADPDHVAELTRDVPDGSPAPPEDRLAFFRDAPHFRNVQLVELPRGDFADVVVKVLLFATSRRMLLGALRTNPDPVLAGLAARASKEVRYHQGFAARWFRVLAGGTEESRRRVAGALEMLWPRLDELVAPDPVLVAGLGVDPAAGGAQVYADLERLVAACGLVVPDAAPLFGARGRSGTHTEALSRMLAEMQSVARAHPLGVW
ncbi:1,2-phenylacetyl-CoA epoxidase subunit PaaC [Nocardioides alcanivorans]|uniref:1,2-phenylacetyl-CoA epoxidase subunit PaaC n=1 Tax=Nocardioides alcanivorans TaxID=2897352 RepID=UPI001F25C50E|nr:1,2-phenylacetyl-CoA epoxidase subunit PaaC [Nocardioides alcanivorans]